MFRGSRGQRLTCNSRSARPRWNHRFSLFGFLRGITTAGRLLPFTAVHCLQTETRIQGTSKHVSWSEAKTKQSDTFHDRPVSDTQSTQPISFCISHLPSTYYPHRPHQCRRPLPENLRVVYVWKAIRGYFFFLLSRRRGGKVRTRQHGNTYSSLLATRLARVTSNSLPGFFEVRTLNIFKGTQQRKV